MKRILFVCHGNICRSPMAEYIAADMISRLGLSGEIVVGSAAVSAEEIGNPVYPPARRVLAEHGIGCDGHRARRMTGDDYSMNDLLVAMDRSNMTRMLAICGGDPDGKMHLLMEYAGESRDVDDPWYSGDFEVAWDDISNGCAGLIGSLAGKSPYCQ